MKYPGRRELLNFDWQPMDWHFDEGFGAMAEQYHFAAISTYNKEGELPSRELPETPPSC